MAAAGGSGSAAAASPSPSAPSPSPSSSGSMAANAASSSSSNPRKFSEKIALQKQRQAEETAAFEEVMMELGTTRLQAQKLRLAHGRGPYCYGGSLPNVNQIGSGAPEFQSPLHSPLDPMRGGARHHRLVKQVQRDPRRMMSPLRRYMRQIDSSPYSPAYLSPPTEPTWRRAGPWGSFPAEKGHLFRLPSALNRTNSDSALHTSVMNPNPQDPYLATSQGGPPLPNRKAGYLENDMDSKVFLFQVPSIEESFLDEGGKQLLKPWDTKKLSSSSARPRSCEVPGIHIFPSPDQPAPLPLLPSPLNTGGSLPDLTNLHFPSPLPTALDPEEPPFPSLSGGSSTGNLASTLTNLGISGGGGGGGGMGLGPPYDPPGLCPALGGSLSNPCLQSSLLGRPLRPPTSASSASASAGGPSLGPSSSSSSSSLQGSLSNPSLRSSPSGGCSSSSSSSSASSSLPSSLSSQSFSSSSLSNPSLSSSLSNPSLPSSSSSLGSNPLPPLPHPGPDPNASSSTSASSCASSPRRRGPHPPLSPLTLPLSADARRQPPQPQPQPPQHQKQFSPTMSPTLSSITQGVPLDTSRLPADQRLPPYPYGQASGLLLQPGHKPLHQGMASQQQQQQRQQQQQQQHQQQQQQQHQQHQMAHHQPHMQQQQQQQHHQPPPCNYPMHYQPNSMFQHQFNQPLGDFGLGNFDQYGFMDNMSGGFSFNSNFPDDLGAFNCFPGDGSGGGGGGPSGGHDPHLLNRQNLSHCSRHGPIPNIILTGDSPPGISKEIASVLAGMPGFEMATAAASSSSSSCSPLALEEDLRIEPLTMDAFNMLSDPFAPLTDTAVEDSFRTDRLQ